MTEPPRRWHLYVVDLGSRVGTKPGKHRPCLAIQPDAVSAFGLRSTVVLPCTTRIIAEPAFPFRVRIPAGTCRLARDSDVVVDQILAWDNALFRDDLGEVPESIQEEVRRALAEFLDITGAG
jgi:mRNA interferase MazF